MIDGGESARTASRPVQFFSRRSEHALDGLARLNTIVPLAERQSRLPPEWRDLHRAILRFWAAVGRPPESTRLSQLAPGVDLPAALSRLCADDLVVGDPHRLIVTGAYPFTAERTAHRVHIGTQVVHAMCAVDALSVAPMLGRPTRIESRCRIGGDPLKLSQVGAALSWMSDGRSLSIGIHWRTPGQGQCTAHTLCREMVFLVGDASAAEWLEIDPQARRLYTPGEAIALGAAFFRPLLGLPAGIG